MLHEALTVGFAAFCLLIPSAGFAEQTPEESAQEAASGAAASNPTASVNFQDVRYRYFDLSGGAETHSVETEGSYVINPRFKISNELRYVDTDRGGRSEQDFEELKIKGILLTDGTPFGVKAKYALGLEWLKDLGDFEDGTGSGADMIAPLAAIGWIPNDKNFIITLVQYFHSYETDSARPDDVRLTAPRLIWIRTIPSISGWFKADLKMGIDHEDGDDFSQHVEFQLGKMVSPKVGFYGEILLGDDVLDTNAFDSGIGIGIRFMY